MWDTGEDYDGVQYDTMWAPSAAQLEAEQIRREVAAEQTRRARS